MLEYNVYEDIAQRSGGDIYVGVVGPVRTRSEERRVGKECRL